MTTRRSRSSGLATPFLWGLAAGAAAGAAWALARRFAPVASNRLFDWDQITAVALRIGASDPPIDPITRDEIQVRYVEVLRRIEGPLAEYTGTGLDLAHTEIHVMDRSDWVRANIGNFRHMFGPIEEAWNENATERDSIPGLPAIGRVAISAEMGLLLGYLARRVLGQYDITLLSPEPEPGKLFFVEPNIQSVQMKLGLPRDEFRTWLMLHEATHAHEFEGFPWVRGYMRDLLHEYLKSMAEQILSGRFGPISSLTSVAEQLLRGGNLLEAAMTPDQRLLFNKLQALMTLLEGYATHLMSAVGQHLVPHFQEIEDRVEARQRERTWPELLFLRITGLQLKFDQYRLGTAFVAAVERERGSAFLHRVWEGPHNLPTLDEFAAPERWMQRMESLAA